MHFKIIIADLFNTKMQLKKGTTTPGQRGPGNNGNEEGTLYSSKLQTGAPIPNAV